MDRIELTHDIRVFYVAAESFPEGITEALDTVYSLVPPEGRNFYGISRPEQGHIIYKAAAEELFPGEGKKYNCDELVLQKGSYVCQTIRNYAENIRSIAAVFETLLQQPGLDPNGYCVEWYSNKTDVICMVRLI